jgi:hypothetical protein
MLREARVVADYRPTRTGHDREVTFLKCPEVTKLPFGLIPIYCGISVNDASSVS